MIDLEKRNKKSKKAIIFGTILGFLGLVVNVISGFVFTPWIIKSLGNSNYGLFTLSNSLISVFLLDFGLSKTVNVYISKYREAGEEEKIPPFIGLVLKIYVLIDLIILICFAGAYFLTPIIYTGLTTVERESFKIIFIITACFSLLSFPTSVFSGVLSSYEKFSAAKIIDITTKILHIIVCLLVLIFTRNIYLYVLANSSVGLLSNITKYIYMKISIGTRIQIKHKYPKEFIKSVFFFSSWAFISAIAGRLLLAFVPNILGIVSNSTEIASFGVSSSIENYVFMFGSITTSFFLPMISRISLIENVFERRKRMNQAALKSAKIQFLMIFIIFCGFVVCGKPFISLWIDGGSAYDNVYLSTIFLIIPELFVVPQSFMYSAMYQKNLVKYIAIPELIAGVCNIGLCFLFGFYFGSLGAALSICISRMITVAVQTIFYHSKGEFDIKYIFKKSFLKIIFASIIPLLISLIVTSFLPKNLYIRLLLPGCLFITLFVVFNLMWSFDREEKKYYFGVFMNAFSRSKNTK